MVHAILVGEQKQGSLRFHLTEHFLPVGWVFKKMQSQAKTHFFMHWFLKHVELVGMLTMSERVAASFHHLRQVLFQLAGTPSDEFPFWNLNQPQMHAHL
jgi:hypothetical protein